MTSALGPSANHGAPLLLRANKSLCGPVGLRPLPADYQPTETALPGVAADELEQEVETEEGDDVYQSAEQLGAELVTLSLLPESRWKSLLHLDVIKVSQAPPTAWTVLSRSADSPMCFVAIGNHRGGTNP